MTDDSNSAKPELKPQFDFSCSGDPPYSSLSFEFQAEFSYHDRKERYSCKRHEISLFWQSRPQIQVMSTFNEEEKRQVGNKIPFLPERVSLGGGACIDIVSNGSGASSGPSSNEFWLGWAPQNEDPVIIGKISTKVKMIIFHLFDFVIFGAGSSPGGIFIEPDIDAERQTNPSLLNFTYDQWETTISENLDYKPKHVGCIQQKSGELFCEEDAKAFIKMLGYAFTRIRGAECKPCCLVGDNEAGRHVWISLALPEFQNSRVVLLPFTQALISSPRFCPH